MPSAPRAPEAAGHQDAVDAGQMRDRVFLLENLGIDPAQFDPGVVGDAAVGQRLLERFIGILQAGIFAGDGDRHLAFRPDHPVDDAHPLAQLRLSFIEPEIAADRGIEALAMQLQRHIVDGFGVERLDHPVGGDVAEQRDLAPRRLRDFPVAAAQQDVRLDAEAEQFLDAVLGRLGLELAGRRDPRHQRQMAEHGAFPAQLVAELPDRLEKR